LNAKAPPGYRLPVGFPKLDFFDDDSGLALVGKTLDTGIKTYVRSPQRIYQKFKCYVDRLSEFENGTRKGKTVSAARIETRMIWAAVPTFTTPEQWTHINAAIDYARTRGITLKVSAV
jgi:hypothetical protein